MRTLAEGGAGADQFLRRAGSAFRGLHTGSLPSAWEGIFTLMDFGTSCKAG